MPLEKREDFALGDENSEFCAYCTDAAGRLKSGEEIFAGGVEFFMNSLAADRALAERVTRKNMSRLPYWQAHACESLNGDLATDEEFQAAMGKL